MITKQLQDWRNGDAEALAHLTTATYAELRRIASHVLRGGGVHQTVHPTALVHELFLQLPGLQHVDWQSRCHFLSTAAVVMRNLLVDYARQQRAAKRGGGAGTVFIEDAMADGNPAVV